MKRRCPLCNMRGKIGRIAKMQKLPNAGNANKCWRHLEKLNLCLRAKNTRCCNSSCGKGWNTAKIPVKLILARAEIEPRITCNSSKAIRYSIEFVSDLLWEPLAEEAGGYASVFCEQPGECVGRVAKPH